MKKFYSILVFLLFNNIYSQLDSTFSELRGYENNLNITHLFYRVNSHFDNGTVSEYFNDIYNIDISQSRDSLFLYDKTYDSPVGIRYTFVTDFQFINNKLSEYYFAGSSSTSFEPVPMIFYSKINSYYGINSFHGETSKVIVDSSSDEYKIYVCVTGSPSGTFQKSNLFYNEFDLIDSMANLYLIDILYEPSLFYFAMDLEGNLLRAKDTMANFQLVDSTKTKMYYYDNLNYLFLHDVDNKHLYRHVVDRNVNYLLVSDNFGDISSWSIKYQSNSHLFFCIDKSQSGTIYLAEGNKVYISNDYAETFLLFKEFDESIKGIYKKPGGALYILTSTKILELSNEKVNVLRELNSGIGFYPLKIGNRWWYKRSSKWNSETQVSYYVKEIIGIDTLSNGFVYYKVKEMDEFSEKIYFERIDTTTGMLYKNENDFDEEIVNLNMKYGESINLNSGKTINYSSTKRVLFQKKVYDIKNYVSTFFEYGGFSLAKDIGQLFKSKLIVDLPELYDTLVGGIINGVIYGDTTKVGINEDPKIHPTVFGLSQNYPNPFNPSTTIKYSIPVVGNEYFRSSQTTLKIYNILGSEVATLVNKQQKAGNYEVNFNASNLSSGVYFYRLQSGSFSESKKMVLIK